MFFFCENAISANKTCYAKMTCISAFFSSRFYSLLTPLISFPFAGAGDDVDFSKVSSLAVSIVNKLDHTQRGLVNTEGENMCCGGTYFLLH